MKTQSDNPATMRVLANGMNDPIYEEREVLATMIVNDPIITDDCLAQLKTADFFYHQHQFIFSAIAALRRDGLPIDEVTLENELQRQGRLAEAGGMVYIIQLLTESVVRGQYQGVIHLVKAHHERRQALELANKIAQSAIADDLSGIESALIAAQKLVTKKATTRWSIIPAADLKTLPPISWLLPGLIPERGLTALYGRSGEGKSFYALNLALQVSQSRPVVYVAAEGQSGYAKRVAAWCIHHKKGEGQLHFCMGAVSLLDESDVQAFIDQLKHYNPAMIVVDTLARTMIGGDENSQRDMSLYIDACSKITEIIGCAVILVHHIGKSGYTPRGSTVLPGACEQMIALTAEDDLIRVQFAKNKDEEGGYAEYLRMVKVDTPHGESIVMLPAENVITSDKDQLSQSQHLVLSELGKMLFIDGAMSGELEDQTHLTRPTLASALNRLLERGLVERAGRGIYKISDKGRLLLKRNDPNDPNDPMIQTIQTPKSKTPSLKVLDQLDHLDQVELFSGGKRVCYP